MALVQKIFGVKHITFYQNIEKRWYISIKVPDFKTGNFIWRKCYGDINKFDTVEDRLIAMEHLAKTIVETQSYQPAQGSRKPGYSNPANYTDTVYQFKKILDMRRHRLRQSSIRKYSGMIRNLERWLIKTDQPHLSVGIFNHEHAKMFLASLREGKQALSNVSYNEHLTLFKSIFAELILNEVVTKNPFVGISGLVKQTQPALYFSKQQIDVLKIVIPANDPQLWQFVQFIYYCFLRPGELRQLRVSDINMHEYKIMVRPSVSKNKKLQYVSIPQQLRCVIEKMNLQQYGKYDLVFGKFGTPGPDMLPINSMKTRHQDILKGLQFSPQHKLYSWKHTGAIACARAGMNLKDLQMQLRHHSLDQVNIYLSSMLVFESDFIKNNFPGL